MRVSPNLIHVTNSDRGIVDIIETARGTFQRCNCGTIKIVIEVVNKKEDSHTNTQKHNDNPNKSSFLSMEKYSYYNLI